MKKNMPPVETRFKDLSGNISVNLKDRIRFTELTSTLVGLDPERFEPIAIRVYIQKVVQITVYAIDKNDHNGLSESSRLPVHKFKLDSDFFKIMPLIKQINFTLSTGEYNLREMEVINKQRS